MNYSIDYYNKKIEQANELTQRILDEFEKDCPDPSTVRMTLADDLSKVPLLDAKYKRRKDLVITQLTTAQKFHARVSMLVKDYYGNKQRHEVEDYEKFGWTELCNTTLLPQERQSWIDADPIYQAVTVWMATHQKNLELVNDNIKVLTERGRQLKTVMDFIRFNNGE